MTMLTDAEQERVRAAIAEAEMQTDAELVTVLANRADQYLYIPTLWAALIALLTPAAALLSPAWLDVADVFVVQLIVFVGLASLLRIPALLTRMVPERVRRWRAANLARRQFLECGLHHTGNEMGVMIFVCEQEHYVEIIADRGVAVLVDDGEWEVIVEHFVNAVREGRVGEGFVEAVAACGAILARVAPATGERNDLPDHLVIVDIDL